MYYLHTNGTLHYKQGYGPGDFESDFVVKFWQIDTRDRSTAWRIIIESLALNADKDEVKRLARKWGCDPKDLIQFISRANPEGELMITGVHAYLEEIAGVNPDEWWGWLGATPKGDQPNYETMPGGNVI
jgi:hypothetical protein